MIDKTSLLDYSIVVKGVLVIVNCVLEKINQIGIVPVVKITDRNQILPLAQSLAKAGIDCMEITFRSDFALEAIEMISNQMPDMLVGAGTVINCQQAKAAIEAGAKFLVSPGYDDELVAFALEQEVVILPGVTSASEIQKALKAGLNVLKFFPAESNGGYKRLKDFAGPFADVKFVPTGGINLNNMLDYLSLNNVLAIGGSFMLNGLESQDFDAVYSDSVMAIKKMLGYELIHIGIDNSSAKAARENALKLCELFNFPYYEKPKSHFASKGFEFLNSKGPGEKGHIAIYTPFIERALYQLNKKGIKALEETITRNKKSLKINFVYLDLELSGFAFHLINPDIKM